MKYGDDATIYRVMAATAQSWCCQLNIARSEAIQRSDIESASKILPVAARCAELAREAKERLEELNGKRTAATGNSRTD